MYHHTTAHSLCHQLQVRGNEGRPKILPLPINQQAFHFHRVLQANAEAQTIQRYGVAPGLIQCQWQMQWLHGCRYYTSSCTMPKHDSGFKRWPWYSHSSQAADAGLLAVNTSCPLACTPRHSSSFLNTTWRRAAASHKTMTGRLQLHLHQSNLNQIADHFQSEDSTCLHEHTGGICKSTV